MGQYKHQTLTETQIKMKYLLSLVSLASLTYSSPQLVFGGSDKTDAAGPRLGLLAANLGLSPTGSQDPMSGSLEEFPSGRVPGAPSVGDDLVGQGLIDPRIVNRPPAQPSPLHSTCPA